MRYHQVFARFAASLLLALIVVPAPAAVSPVQTGAVPSLAPVLKDVTPAVVNISVVSRSPEEDNPLLQDPFFRRFFNLPERPKPQLSAGSGVIVDAAKGYVLTNHHVVKEAREIVVTLKDRRQFEAKLVGSDAGTDIALLKIDPDRLTALKFGDSDALSVGDFVIAIGNPFGLGQTVTSGIVSALSRTGLSEEGYEDFIQTDASINPGNSGGALVNLKGELVGINSAIIGPAGGNVGIGFAVPSNMARAVMSQLVRYGEVRRGRFGVTTQDVTPDIARAMKLASAEGAVVVDVERGGAADRAGLKRGDVVVQFNGRPVRSSADLRNKLALVPVGEDVELKLLREGHSVVARSRIEPARVQSARGAESVPELAGLTVGSLDAPRAEGVAVVGVDPGSPAWYHGLRPGDLILGVNRRKVQNIRELTAALRQAQRPIVLNVRRGDFILAIVIR